MSIQGSSTITEVMNVIQTHCPFFKPNSKNIKNEDVLLKEYNIEYNLLIKHFENICVCYSKMVSEEVTSESDANQILNRMISEPGSLYEALGIYWLHKSSLCIALKTNYSTNQNNSGVKVDLDGIIEGKFAFDIKKFQLYENLIQPCLEEMETKYPNYTFMVCGFSDVNKEKFWNKNVEISIENGIKQGLKRFGVKLPNGGVIQVEERETVNMAESSFSITRWSENTYKFVLSDSNQFTTTMPFMQIEMFDKTRFDSFGESVYMVLRIMARRIFFELTKCEEKIHSYCSKIQDAEKTVKNAMGYLSAICFMDVNSGEAWTFTNPFAAHKLNIGMLEPYTWDNVMIIDNFNYDNY